MSKYPENNFKRADDDMVQPFQLESSDLRGRAVRLGSVLDEVLGPHDYPNPVAHLVGEVMVVTLLLSSMLKYDGIFTLQAAGDGPVGMLVADATSEGEIRGCASYDIERLQHAREQLAALEAAEGSQNHLAQYLGKGRLAFTVDQGEGDRHQGIVELKGSSIVDCVQHYFTQSEQISTGIKMAVGRRAGKWRAGAIMLQTMPGEGGSRKEGGHTDADDWRRAMVLLGSCTEEEFLDLELHSNELLLRLFHEEGVRVFEPFPVSKGCRCDAKKVEKIIAMMPQEDRDYMEVDGKIVMRCEFCSRDFIFDPAKKSVKLAGEDGLQA